MQAARYLKVAPWELDTAPTFWMEAALLSMQIDNDAAEARKK